MQWHAGFIESANLIHGGGNGRPRTREETVEQVRSVFQDQPRLSIRQAASALDISTATVYRTLRKCLFMYPYRLQTSMAFKALTKSSYFNLLDTIKIN